MPTATKKAPAKKRAPNKKAVPKTVHRNLHFASPITKGADVRALQAAVRALFKHYKIGWLPLKVDGQLGKQTLHAVAFIAWVLGFSATSRAKIKAGTITQEVQHLIRNPEKRGRAYRTRESLRKGKLAAIRKRQEEGTAAAVAYAKACVGITEDPYGSNAGPTVHVDVNGKSLPAGITFWEAYWRLTACYWCLVFACYCVREIGGAKIPGPDQAYLCVNAAEIERQAKAHVNGFVVVAISELRAGDLALWCFDGSGIPDHGELVIGPYRGHSNDIGGNTSDGAGGSQSNGGGVFARPDRDLAQLTCGVRPLYG